MLSVFLYFTPQAEIDRPSSVEQNIAPVINCCLWDPQVMCSCGVVQGASNKPEVHITERCLGDPVPSRGLHC